MGRGGKTLMPDDILRNVQFNQTIRKQEIQKILEETTPDFLLGDFNFESDDPEF